MSAIPTASVLDVERAEGSFEMDVGTLLFIDKAEVGAAIPPR
jgi:hypothetical protein